MKLGGFELGYLNSLNYKTPFMVVDQQLVVDKYRLLKNELFDIDKIHYALKCNPDESVLLPLIKEGSNFEIASIGEYELLARHGVTADRIVYSNPVKPAEHIRTAFESGIKYFAFDSINELEKLAINAPGGQVYARVEVGDNSSVFPLSKKFGLPSNQVIQLMLRAKKMGLKPVGLTFHVGSQTDNPYAWNGAIKLCSVLISELLQKGVRLEFLDIGGGLPANYSNETVKLTDFTRVIKTALATYLPYSLRIIIEPGRYLVAESSVIAATIIGIERREETNWLYLDMGVFQGLMEVLEISDWQFPLASSIDGSSFKKDRYILTGPSCDPYDIITESAVLPSVLSTGDRIYIGSSGAYTTSYGSNFNGFSPPQVYPLKTVRQTHKTRRMS